MRTILLVPFLLAAGCAKEKPATKPNVIDREGGITDATQVPSDTDSKKFADHLVRHPLKGYHPTDADGPKVLWVETTFNAKNEWVAVTKVQVDAEDVDCRESGTWSMDKAESNQVAVVAMRTLASTCAGRADNIVYHLKLSWTPDEKGAYDVQVH